MPVIDEYLSAAEVARVLGVSVRQVQLLGSSGDLEFGARGLVDRGSLELYRRARQGSRRRAWSESTAWAAVALLSGVDAGWVGATQRSRLRTALRDASALDNVASVLVARTRNRAVVRRFVGHASSAARLRREVPVVLVSEVLGLVDDPATVDGYLSAAEVADVVARHGLEESSRGRLVLRSTGFDLAVIEAIATAGGLPVLAALDAAASLDPRTRGVGEAVLRRALDQYVGGGDG